MGIADDDIAKVRQSADIVKVVTEHIALRKVGRRWVGLCPFHNERSGSFSVNAEEGLYHCFGCKASGDTITFVREVEGLDFVGAVEKLAAMSGITLRYDNQKQGERRDRKKRLIEAIGQAVAFYHERLLSAPDAGPARAYLKSRGYDGETVRRYQLGWAPDAWDALAQSLSLSDRDLKDAGLGFVNRRGRQQDFFRARVLFPIYNIGGEPIGFGGRKMPDADGPKYRNTSDDCLVYDKSSTLYGLHWAKSDMVRAGDDGEAIICEGYTDVHGFAAVGFDRAVATCGTALTEEHIKILTRFAHRLVLAFDADEAGQTAAERIHQWETTYELDVRVADLPGGHDPGDLARTDPEGLRRAVDEAKPFLQFRVDRVLGGADLSSAEGRARAARAAVTVVRDHPSDLVRDDYLQRIADRCRVDVERLRKMADAPADDGPPPLEPNRPPRVERHRDTAEDEALRLLIQAPDEIRAGLHPVLFADERHRAAALALLEADSVHQALAVVDPDLGDFIRSMAVADVDAEGEDLLARLVDLASQRMLDGLQAEARTADDPGSYAEPVAWLKHRMEDLRERDTRTKALDDLLPWLIEHGEERRP